MAENAVSGVPSGPHQPIASEGLTILEEWGARGATYGVNPGVFILLYAASLIPFYVGVWDAVHGWRYKQLSRVRRGLLLNRLAWATPYLYVLIAGHGLPWWVQTAVVAWLGFSLILFLRRGRRQVTRERWTRIAEKLGQQLRRERTTGV